MRKLRKILIPLLVLALLVGVFAIVVGASDAPVATDTITGGASHTYPNQYGVGASTGSYTVGGQTVNYDLATVYEDGANSWFFKSPNLTDIVTSDGTEYTYGKRYAVWSIDIATASEIMSAFKVHWSGKYYSAVSADAVRTSTTGNITTFTASELGFDGTDAPYAWHNFTMVLDFENNNIAVFADGSLIKTASGFYNSYKINTIEGIRIHPTDYGTTGTSIAFANSSLSYYADDSTALEALAGGSVAKLSDSTVATPYTTAGVTPSPEAQNCTVYWKTADGSTTIATSTHQVGAVAAAPAWVYDRYDIGGWAAEANGTTPTMNYTASEGAVFYAVANELPAEGVIAVLTDNTGAKYNYTDALTLNNALWYSKSNYRFDIYRDVTINNANTVDLGGKNPGAWPYNNTGVENLSIYVHGGATLTYAGTNYMFKQNNVVSFTLGGVTSADGTRGKIVTNNYVYGSSTAKATYNFVNVDITTTSSLVDLSRGQLNIDNCNITNNSNSYGTYISAKATYDEGEYIGVRITDTVFTVNGTASGNYAYMFAPINVYQTHNAPVVIEIDGNTQLISNNGNAHSIYIGNTNASSTLYLGGDVVISGINNKNTNLAVTVEEGLRINTTTAPAFGTTNVKFTDGTTATFAPVTESDAVVAYEAKVLKPMATLTRGDAVTNYYDEAALAAALAAAQAGDRFDIYSDYTETAGNWAAISVYVHGGATLTVELSSASVYLSNQKDFTLEGVTEDGVRGKLDYKGGAGIFYNYGGTAVTQTLRNLDVTTVAEIADIRAGSFVVDGCTITSTNEGPIRIHPANRYVAAGFVTNLTINNSTITVTGTKVNAYDTPVYVSEYAYTAVNVSLTGTTELICENGNAYGIYFANADSSKAQNSTLNTGYGLYLGADVYVTGINNLYAGLPVTVETGFASANEPVFSGATVTDTEGNAGFFALSESKYVFLTDSDDRLVYIVKNANGAVLGFSFETDVPADFFANYAGATVTFKKDANIVFSADTVNLVNITVDLGKKTLTFKADGTNATYGRYSLGSVTVTFKNGTINQENGDNLVYANYGTGEGILNLEDLTVNAHSAIIDYRQSGTVSITRCNIISDQTQYNLISLSGHSSASTPTVVLKDSTFTSGGGRIISNGNAANVKVNLDITVDGCTFNSPGYAFYAGGSDKAAGAGSTTNITITNSKITTSMGNLVAGGGDNLITTVTLGKDTYTDRVALGDNMTLVIADGYALADGTEEDGYLYKIVTKANIGVKANLTLYTTLTLNLYLPMNAQGVWVDGVYIELTETAMVGETEYYKVELADVNACYAANLLEVKISFENNGSVQYSTKNISVVTYLSAALSLGDEASKNLTASVIRYVDTAYTYSNNEGRTDELNALLADTRYTSVLATLKTGTPAETAKAEVENITNIFSDVQLNLGGSFRVRFVIDDNFTGDADVTINGVTYHIVGGYESETKYIEVAVRAYNVYDKNVVIKGAVSGEYNIVNYIYSVKDTETYTADLANLLDALYYYCEYASAYNVAKNNA